MPGTHHGFVALLKACVPAALGVHCVIHEDVLCAKLAEGETKLPADSAVQTVPFRRARPLRQRPGGELVDQSETEDGDRVMPTEVRRLCPGKVLGQFLALLPEIQQFLAQKSQMYPKLEDENWILDVTFLIAITSHLNALNESLQGENHLLPAPIASVRKCICTRS